MSRALIAMIFALSSVSGCGGGLASLEQPQQHQFNRCRTYVLARRCTPSEERVYDPHCEGDLIARYCALPAEPERQRWLVRNGCPRELVGTVSSGNDSVATTPPPATP